MGTRGHESAITAKSIHIGHIFKIHPLRFGPGLPSYLPGQACKLTTQSIRHYTCTCTIVFNSVVYT